MQQISLLNQVSQWNLDGVADLLGANPLTNVSSVPFITGLFGRQCASLTGSLINEFTAADSASLEISGAAATWAIWFKPTNLSNTVMGLMLKGANTGTLTAAQHEYGCNFSTANSLLTFRASNGTTTTTVSTANAISYTAWNLGLFWMDSSNKLNIQLNGGTAAINSTALSGGIWNGGSNGWPLYLGYSSVTGVARYYTGLMGPISFWKRVLTAAERALLWNGGAGLAFPFGYDQPPAMGGGMNDLVGGIAA